MTSRFDDPDRADGDPDDHEPDDADDFLREVARVDDIAPPARAPSPGQTLGRFRILSELGRGGMGIVYLAHDENLRRAVALKLLSPSIARKDERTRRFLREARAAASVTHTNLATIYDVGEVEGNVFIAMERVEGRTLRKVLAAGRPSIEQAVDIATQILAGLAKAHLAGIVHRDLKPDNIMLTDDGVVKLLDFGLAKQHDGAASGVRAADVAAAAAAGSSDALDSAPHDTAENQLLGTPGYMSPEQVRNSLIDPRSDIFAFGVVFYEMLAGQRPFVGQTHADLASAILRDTPRRLGELRPEVPNELERLVERCLEKDPARRYPSSGALAIALAQLDLVGASRFATPSGSSPSGSTPAPDVLSTSGASAAVARTPSLMRRASERAGAAARIFGAVLVVSLAGLYFRSSRGGGDEVENDLAEARRDVAEARRDKAEAQRDKADAKRSTTEVEREQTVAAALAARSVPTPVTELPLPQSKSPEALVAYRAALQGIRDGNWGYVQAHLERALELDPGLAIAHLRLAMIRHHSPRMRPREQFAMAIAGRASMNEREQTLLHACEPLLYRDPPDPAEYVARLRVATERFPGDAELFGMLGWEQQDNPEAMLEGARRRARPAVRGRLAGSRRGAVQARQDGRGPRGARPLRGALARYCRLQRPARLPARERGPLRRDGRGLSASGRHQHQRDVAGRAGGSSVCAGRSPRGDHRSFQKQVGSAQRGREGRCRASRPQQPRHRDRRLSVGGARTSGRSQHRGVRHRCGHSLPARTAAHGALQRDEPSERSRARRRRIPEAQRRVASLAGV